MIHSYDLVFRPSSYIDLYQKEQSCEPTINTVVGMESIHWQQLKAEGESIMSMACIQLSSQFPMARRLDMSSFLNLQVPANSESTCSPIYYIPRYQARGCDSIRPRIFHHDTLVHRVVAVLRYACPALG